MHDKHSLIYRITNQEPQDLLLQDHPQVHQQPEPTLLNRISQRVQTPRLLDRMSSPDSLQGLPLKQAQEGIKMYSSSATPSLKDIERGRSPKHQYMSTSNLNSPKPLEMTEPGPMQPSGLSSRLSKVTTLRSKRHREEEASPHSTHCSAPPALLYRFQMGMDQMVNQPPKRLKSTNQSMPGLPVGKTNAPCYETVSQKHSSSLKPIQSILKQPNDLLSMNQIVPNSPILNGRTLSLEERLTSMPYSVDNCLPPKMIPKSRSSETLRSRLELLNRLKWSRTEVTGPSPGTEQLGLQPSLSPTEYKNSRAMENTSSTSSQSLIPASIAELLPSTKRSGKGLEVLETSSSLTSRNLLISRSRTWIRSGYQSSRALRKTEEIRKARKAGAGKRTNLATNGMMGSVAKRMKIAGDYMSATNVEKEGIEARNVEQPDFIPERPKYFERSVWTDVEASPMFSPTACCTLTQEPLPRPPAEEFANHDAISTIEKYPHLFR